MCIRDSSCTRTNAESRCDRRVHWQSTARRSVRRTRPVPRIPAPSRSNSSVSLLTLRVEGRLPHARRRQAARHPPDRQRVGNPDPEPVGDAVLAGTFPAAAMMHGYFGHAVITVQAHERGQKTVHSPENENSFQAFAPHDAGGTPDVADVLAGEPVAK